MDYHLDFSDKAVKDIALHKKAGNKAIQKKLHTLLKELVEHPKTGTGKPEQLKHYEIPTWSRRISGEHRLVYRIQDEVVTVLVLSAFGHYGDK